MKHMNIQFLILGCNTGEYKIPTITRPFLPVYDDIYPKQDDIVYFGHEIWNPAYTKVMLECKVLRYEFDYNRHHIDIVCQCNHINKVLI